MTLIASEAIAEISHSIAGLPERSGMRIANEAGRFLASMHGWNFLKRPKVTLASVADQAYIDLPADFDSVVGVTADTTSFTRGFTFVDTAAFLALEELAWGNEYGPDYYAIIEWPLSTDGTAPVPRLALFPAPSTTDATFAQLRYKAGWKTLNDDADTVQIPEFAETLYLQLCRTFSKGYEEEDEATLDQRLALIQAGGVLMAARRADGRSQWKYGTMRGGAAGSCRRSGYSPIDYTGVTP